MDQTCPLFVYFRPFSLTIINIVQLTINEKGCSWSTWDSNPDRRMDGADPLWPP